MPKLSQPKIKLPKRYCFSIVHSVVDYENYTYIYLNDKSLTKTGMIDSTWSAYGGTRIGRVTLAPSSFRKDKKFFYRTHSTLDSKYHGKGLGTMMYAKAIQWALSEGHRVSSSGDSSMLAKRMWTGKSIRKYCKVVARVRADGRPIWYCYSKGVK